MDVEKVTIDISDIQRKWLNVPYANLSSAEKLDIYLPDDGDGPFPVIMIIHGGGFAFGDKQGIELSTALEPSLKRGYAVVSINYRLSGEAKFPAAIEDVKAAIRFIRANAYQYSLSPNKLALWGSSAGGNLAALAGTTDRMTVFNNPELGNIDTPTMVTAVIDFFGPINFLTMDKQFTINGINGIDHDLPNSFESMYLGAPIQEVPWLVKESNPQTFLNLGVPPFLIEHGTKDDQIPYQQSVIFSELLSDFIPARDIRLQLIDGAGHGGPEFNTPENLDLVFSFLDRYMV